LTALATAFDQMLDRLEASFEQLSQFSADLAHELRTPINALIGETEVALSQPRSSEEYRRVLESNLEAGVLEPLDLDGVLARRIARLAPRERRTLAAICLTPRPVSLNLLAQITDQPDPESSARELECAQLARFASGPQEAVAAFHDRVREVVLSGLDPSERAALHGRSVEALEASGADVALLSGSGSACFGVFLDPAAAAGAAAALSARLGWPALVVDTLPEWPPVTAAE